MPMKIASATQQCSNAAFPPTRWSQLLALRDSRQREVILNDLCHAYWKPLYAFLRRSGQSPSDAKDVVQSFFLRLINHGTFESVDSRKGRLRTFLMASLRNHLLNQK